ncbi:HD-GYP domain-containing protein [Spirochaetota bacterium]
MATEKLKIDLTYLGKDNTLIYPIYSRNGEKILDARMNLTGDIINSIIKKHGKIVYYTFSEEMDNIPNHRISNAFNQSKEIVEEIMHSDKLSKATYKKSEGLIELILSDLRTTKTETIRLIKNLSSFDDYIYNHSVNVMLLVAVFASQLEIFSLREKKSLIMGAYLHDIGKMKIDKQLLNKKDKLDISEFKKMKRHPQLGYEIVKDIAEGDMIIQQTILFHHEKYNNTGYFGLPYENLPIFPKIVSICDIFDALTSKRPYRDAVSPIIALRMILNYLYDHFNYDLISNFLNRMGPILNNAGNFYVKYEICELNTHELALIVGPGEKDVLTPKIIVFCKFQRFKKKFNVKYYEKPIFIDLSKDKSRVMKNILSNNNQVNMIKDRLLERCLFQTIV